MNNDNLKSPPYLLEAIKRAEASEAASQLVANVVPPMSRTPIESVPKTGNAGPRLSEQLASAPKPARTNEAVERDLFSFGPIKEDTIEEVLDLEPESLTSGISPSDYSKLTNEMVASASEPQTEMLTSLDQQQSGRKPQLPVTTSHLKRPLLAPENQPEEVAAKRRDENNSSQGPAKSLVSPRVASDDEPPAASSQVEQLQKKRGPTPPDTWEPSQVMNGVTNASLVPATVTREYGSNTRTRITLGGGYVRNRLPALVNPASSEYVDDRPEKPAAPLERPQPLDRPRASGEVSRVIEVPERIVLPAGIFDKNSASSDSNKFVVSLSSNNSATRNRSPDPRCPDRGVTSLEHPTACDKYFVCDEGSISEHTCPNGLMYGTRDLVRDYCVHRWQAVCGDKSVPNPISSPGCRWQYGIFSVQGSPRCTPDFYECAEGRFEVRKCSLNGQVYDDRTKSCQYAEQVGCAEEALAHFHCPPDDQANTYWPFPRYFLNNRALIHCINDKPAIVRCREDERVDPEHLHCVPTGGGSGAEAAEGLLAGRLREKKAPPKAERS